MWGIFLQNIVNATQSVDALWLPSSTGYIVTTFNHFFHEIGACSINLCKNNPQFSRTLELHPLISQTQPVHLQLTSIMLSPSVFKIEALIQVSFWRALKFQPCSWRVGSNPRRHSRIIEMKHMTHIKLVHEFYMIHVSNTMWRVKNQPSHSTSCSDNALRLLVLVMGRSHWGLHVRSSFSI